MLLYFVFIKSYNASNKFLYAKMKFNINEKIKPVFPFW